MALVVTGTKTRSGSIFSAVRRHVAFLNLKPAKRVLIKFDPFGENTRWLRHFSYLMSRKAVRQTNTDCRVNTQILSDNSEPTVEVTLLNGESLLMKCGKLNIVEMLFILNKHVSALVPKEEAPNVNVAAKLTKKHSKK